MACVPASPSAATRPLQPNQMPEWRFRVERTATSSPPARLPPSPLGTETRLEITTSRATSGPPGSATGARWPVSPRTPPSNTRAEALLRRDRFGLRQLLQPAANVAWRVEAQRYARNTAADGNSDAVEFRHDGERGLVGRVVADEDGPSRLERLVAHQPAHRRPLVEAGRLDLEHRLAGQ